MSQKIFFVTGLPKSGTTLLQMLLDRHPQVSCPSEHEFAFLLRSLRYGLGAYNQVLINKDNLTARQGARLLTDDDIHQVFKAAVVQALKSAGPGKGAVGAKDNDIRQELDFYNELFDRPKFIVIVRDPRGVAVSAYHHNRRIEANFAARAGSPQQWAVQIARWWKNHVNELKRFAAAGAQLHIVRYVDLISDKKNVCRRLFDFLQVDSGELALDAIVAETAFERLKTSSGNNPFYRQGRADSWKPEISPETNRVIEDICRDELGRFGYELSRAGDSCPAPATALPDMAEK